MATVNLNLPEKDKAKLDFLVTVSNKILDVKTSKTDILKTLLNKYFEENKKYLDFYEEYGEISALQKIQDHARKAEKKKVAQSDSPKIGVGDNG